MILGDLQAKEQLKNALEQGIKNRCPETQKFLHRVEQAFYKKNTSVKTYKKRFGRFNHAIINLCTTPYRIMLSFIIIFFIMVTILEMGAYKYVV